EKMKKNLTDWQNFGQKATSAQDKEKADKAIVDLKRGLEDLERKAAKEFGQKREAQLVQLYKEVNDVAKGYAQSNGFHVVLMYGEPTTESEQLTAQNIGRKLQTLQVGGCMPMYFAGGL